MTLVDHAIQEAVRKAVADALERAAKLAETWTSMAPAHRQQELAAAIRALKESP